MYIGLGRAVCFNQDGTIDIIASIISMMEQQAVTSSGASAVFPQVSQPPILVTQRPLQVQASVVGPTPSGTTNILGNPPGLLPSSAFTTANLEVPPPPITAGVIPSLGNLTNFNEVVNKLNRLFEDQLAEIEQYTEDHWKSQEFPLARIKKIMRMDEEVKMISAEVPIMLSKAIEIFITELTLRGWLHTEEAKRRTVQRSDLAMAITKHDMFDFLIDIVPREEMQVKAKTGLKLADGDQLQLLSPEVLQLYIQQLLDQQATHTAEESEEAGDQNSVNLATGLIQQQLQLLQQLIQLQQLQAQEIEQQQQNTTPLQHPPQTAPAQTSQVLHHATHSSLLQSQSSLDSGTVVQSIASPVNLSGGHQILRHTPSEVLMDTQQPHSATLVLPEGLMDPQQSRVRHLQHIPPPPPLLQTQGQYQLRHLDNPSTPTQGELTVHSVMQQVLDQGASRHFSSPPPLNPVSTTEGVVEFRHIPETESISRSISPITLQHVPEVMAYHHEDVATLSSDVVSTLASSLGLQSDSLQNQLASIVSSGHSTSQTKSNDSS